MLSANFPCSASEWAQLHSSLLSWAKEWRYFAVYENQGGKGWGLPFKLLCGKSALVLDSDDIFTSLESARENALLEIGGYFAYDLKNKIEKLRSDNPDRIHAPEACFFEADVQIEYDGKHLKISAEEPEEICSQIQQTKALTKSEFFFDGRIDCGMEKDEYLNKVQKIRSHIEEGDVYELNLCVEFFSEQCKLDPYQAYFRLREKSNVPMSAFLKLGQFFVLSASPERFLSRNGNHLISQPIKGTRRRSSDAREDELLKEELYHSEKDRAENVMIVDLVRNDFAHSCKPGSISVPELFGIYSFPQVHQMISEIQGELKEDSSGMEALKYCFPMGSMTGAPKVMAMELIEQLENARRGIYSGAIGYIEPNGNFDFNVVIRTLVYNEKDSVLSFQAGGAITYDSQPKEEWNELLLKASAIRQMLNEATYPQDLPVT